MECRSVDLRCICRSVIITLLWRTPTICNGQRNLFYDIDKEQRELEEKYPEKSRDTGFYWKLGITSAQRERLCKILLVNVLEALKVIYILVQDPVVSPYFSILVIQKFYLAVNEMRFRFSMCQSNLLLRPKKSRHPGITLKYEWITDTYGNRTSSPPCARQGYHQCILMSPASEAIGSVAGFAATLENAQS